MHISIWRSIYVPVLVFTLDLSLWLTYVWCLFEDDALLCCVVGYGVVVMLYVTSDDFTVTASRNICIWHRILPYQNWHFYLLRATKQRYFIPESWAVVIGGKMHFSLTRNEQLTMKLICQSEIRFLLSFPVACLKISVQFWLTGRRWCRYPWGCLEWHKVWEGHEVLFRVSPIGLALVT